jgi:hypothetical protein
MAGFGCWCRSESAWLIASRPCAFALYALALLAIKRLTLLALIKSAVSNQERDFKSAVLFKSAVSFIDFIIFFLRAQKSKT